MFTQNITSTKMSLSTGNHVEKNRRCCDPIRCCTIATMDYGIDPISSFYIGLPFFNILALFTRRCWIFYFYFFIFFIFYFLFFIFYFLFFIFYFLFFIFMKCLFWTNQFVRNTHCVKNSMLVFHRGRVDLKWISHISARYEWEFDM